MSGHFVFILRYGYRDFGIRGDFIRTILMSDDGKSHWYVRSPLAQSFLDGQSY
jgi:hypothetical protein